MMFGDYQKVLDYLYKQLPMYQRQGPIAFKKDLTNIYALTKVLDNPHESFPTLHIAGTNGKGSTAHLLSAILQAAGFKVGLYTSPHYRDFRERIKINGELIPPSFVLDFVNNHYRHFKDIQPSFFEISVAMAFEAFRSASVDIAVIETGLGGRLDSTNILQPLLSIITNISFDHQQFLGNSLPEIAGEKAGIIKSNTPVVIGERNPQTDIVFENKAAKETAPIYFAEDYFSVKEKSTDLSHTIYQIYEDGKLWLDELKTNIHGTYQAKNLRTVICALKQLPVVWRVDETSIRNGLFEMKQLTNFIGRWQILQQDPLIVFDSAHNEGGIIEVMRQIGQIDCQHLRIVLGMVKDKDHEKLLGFFPKSATYYFAKPNVPRGMDATELLAVAENVGLSGTVHKSLQEAYSKAQAEANIKDMIFVGGSTFVVAELL